VILVIRNCIWGYKCQAFWSDLSKTDDESIRFCGECEKEVFYCNSPEELQEAIALNKCVNFHSSLIVSKSDEKIGDELINKRLTGMPGPGITDITECVLADFNDDIPF
jgi:hypothetical protein